MKFSLTQQKVNLARLINPQKLVPGSRNDYLLKGTVLGIIPALLIYFLCVSELSNKVIFFWLPEPIWVVLSIFATMAFCHELSHLLVSPKMGFTNETIVGFDPKVVTPFVEVMLPMKRNFFIIHALAPLVIFTSISLLIAFTTHSTFIAGWFSSMAIANAYGSGADILSAYYAYKRMSTTDHHLGNYYGALNTENN